MSVTRQQVYVALDSERNYQDRKWSDQQEVAPGIDAFAAYVQGYTNELIHSCSHTSSIEERLNFFRKVGALCVACMEAHGAPLRNT